MSKLWSKILVWTLTIGIPALCSLIYKWYVSHQGKKALSGI